MFIEIQPVLEKYTTIPIHIMIIMMSKHDANHKKRTRINLVFTFLGFRTQNVNPIGVYIKSPLSVRLSVCVLYLKNHIGRYFKFSVCTSTTALKNR